MAALILVDLKRRVKPSRARMLKTITAALAKGKFFHHEGAPNKVDLLKRVSRFDVLKWAYLFFRCTRRGEFESL